MRQDDGYFGGNPWIYRARKPLSTVAQLPDRGTDNLAKIQENQGLKRL